MMVMVMVTPGSARDQADQGAEQRHQVFQVQDVLGSCEQGQTQPATPVSVAQQQHGQVVIARRR
jgi:hypothetical protein